MYIFTHTFGVARSQLIVSLVGQMFWAGKAEKWEVTWPLMTIYLKIGASELSFFRGGAGYLVLVLHPTSFLATG